MILETTASPRTFGSSGLFLFLKCLCARRFCYCFYQYATVKVSLPNIYFALFVCIAGWVFLKKVRSCFILHMVQVMHVLCDREPWDYACTVFQGFFIRRLIKSFVVCHVLCLLVAPKVALTRTRHTGILANFYFYRCTLEFLNSLLCLLSKLPTLLCFL